MTIITRMKINRINMLRMRPQLVLHEGLYLKPYNCPAGALTIGVGYNIDAHGPPFGMNLAEIMQKGITKEQAMSLLDKQINGFAYQLDYSLPWWREQDEVRMRVLLDMAFNMGISGLLTFRNTLKSVERGDYENAAIGMSKSKWARQVKTRATRLIEMMRTGQDSTDF